MITKKTRAKRRESGEPPFHGTVIWVPEENGPRATGYKFFREAEGLTKKARARQKREEKRKSE